MSRHREAPLPTAPRRARVTIREIVDARDPALGAAYALLRRTFPRGERVERREWTDTLNERAQHLWSDLAWHLLVAERGGEVVGLASGTYVGNVNVGVIGYLVAAPGTRAGGLGSRLRERLLTRFRRDALRIAGRPLEAVVGEVSVGNRWLRHLAARRDVLLLDVPYFQPRLHDDDVPSPFVLYYQAVGRPRRRIPVPELRRLLYALWRRVYRIPRPLERPAFRAMLRALEGRRSVGTRSLDRMSLP